MIKICWIFEGYNVGKQKWKLRLGRAGGWRTDMIKICWIFEGYNVGKKNENWGLGALGVEERIKMNAKKLTGPR